MYSRESLSALSFTKFYQERVVKREVGRYTMNHIGVLVNKNLKGGSDVSYCLFDIPINFS